MKTAMSLLLLLTGMTLGWNNQALAQEQPAGDSELTVNIQPVRSERGHILYTLWSSEESFNNRSGGFRSGKLIPTLGEVSFVLSGLPPGTYALTVTDDENDNGRLDRFMGLPTEFFGISNITHMLFAPPTWKEAKFDIVVGHQNEISILLKKH